MNDTEMLNKGETEGILANAKMIMDVKLVDPEFFEEHGLPSYGTEASAGLDLIAYIDDAVVVEAGKVELIPTGMHIQLPADNLAAMLLPKSGIGHKKGIVLGNLVGLIDADYRNQMFVSVWNRSSEDYTINPGDKVCQMVVVPVLQMQLNIVDELNETNRGMGGFGSTGRRINN